MKTSTKLKLVANLIRRQIEKPLKRKIGIKSFYKNYLWYGYYPPHLKQEILNWQAEKCINCSLCIQVCPALTIHPDKPLPIMAINALRFTEEIPYAYEIIFRCTHCGACTQICPSQIQIPEIIANIRRIIFKWNEHLRHTSKSLTR